MNDKPDLIETVRDLETFAINPTERKLAKELGSLLFEHSALKAENAKLKQDLHHYMMAANAEAELVDELQKENRILVRQNSEWQARSKEDKTLLWQALACLTYAAPRHDCIDAAAEYERMSEATITALKERLK